MPQCHKVKSLHAICIEVIVKNLDAGYCETVANVFANACEPIDNPFEHLPNKLLVDVINALRTEGCLKQFIAYLAVPSLETLDFTCLYSDDDKAIQLKNSMRCVNLKQLTLLTFSVNSELFHSFIPMLAKLQILDISYSGTDDYSLQVIGMNCTDLRKLNIKGCDRLSDAGVKGFCVGAAPFPTRECSGLHQSLISLCAKGTAISNTGVQLILENFPKLKVFDLATVQTLTEIHGKVVLYQNREMPIYALLTLHVPHYAHYQPRALGFVLRLCPYVVKVEINVFDGLSNDDLQSLTFLKNLSTFLFYGNRNARVSFHGGIVPILKTFGKSSLESLALSHFLDFDCHVLIQLCPNLVVLELSDNESQTVECLAKSDCNVLRHLEKLRLAGGDISRKHLMYLLSPPLLFDIDIVRCSTFNDDVIVKVAGIRKFQHLQKLNVRQCDGVTKKGIDELLNTHNSLKEIAICFCSNIFESDVANWEKQAKANNWELSVFFW